MRAALPSLFVLALATPLLAAPDALKTHRTESKRASKEESRYWREYQDRYNDAYKTFRAPMEQDGAKSAQFPEAVYDYSGLEALYDAFAQIQRNRGAADLALAGSGDPKAAAQLLDDLLDLCKRAAKLDKELLEAKPMGGRYVFDQRPAIERHGLEFRRAALVEALGKCAEAAAYLSGDGWKKARRADGKRDVCHRVAVLDAIAGCDDDGRPLLIDQLDADSSTLRIAAIEGLTGTGSSDIDQLSAQLGAPNPLVRRALFQEISRKATSDPGWIGPLVKKLPALEGLEAALCVSALESLTRQTFGHDPKSWTEWFDEYRKEIESGSFDPEKVEVREVERVPVPAAATFYGIESSSRDIVFVIEGSSRIACPADWEIQRTKIRWSWKGTRHQWEKEHPSHQTILAREMEATLVGLGDEGTFGIVVLQGRFGQDLLDKKKLLPTGARNRAAALKMIRKMPASGWCSPYAGLLRASQLAGLDPALCVDFPKPAADTIYLLDSGDPAGGRYMTPETALAAFRRFNRFRRLVVHSLRICNEKEASELLMKGIAEASGGSYRWLKTPP